MRPIYKTTRRRKIRRNKLQKIIDGFVLLQSFSWHHVNFPLVPRQEEAGRMLMENDMKILATTSALLMLATASAATAKPVNKGFKSWNTAGKHHVVKYHAGRLTPYERIRIAKSRKRLAQLKRRVRADGRVTRFERRQVRAAQIRHQRLVQRLRRS